MANPIAVPGTNVPSGAAVSPGGAQGPSAVSANANNKATLGSDSLVLVQGTAAGVAATTHTQTVSGDDPQLTNARTPTAHEASHVTGSDQIPLASSSTKGLLNQTSGNTTDFIDGTNNSQALQPVIWSVRLRSFNAIGNPTFEVDQKNVGTMVAGVANNIGVIDRWRSNKAGATMVVNQGTVAAPAGTVVVPGTNFCITTRLYRFLLTTQQASLAAGDVLGMFQVIEGPRWRELSLDTHSVSLIVRTGVAGLKFSVALRDSVSSQTLVKLCTVPSADTFTLIQLPNLPLWPSGGTFSSSPGANSYTFFVILAAGSSMIAPAADTWQTGSFSGAPGMSNFAASPVNSYFDIAFIQHEPGAQCTTPQDCPFTQNYDDCLRYYTKSYSYATAVGTVTTVGCTQGIMSANLSPIFYIPFKKTMARVPTVTGYSTATGAVNNVRDGTNVVDKAITSVNALGDSAFSGFTVTSPAASIWQPQMHYTADTGW